MENLSRGGLGVIKDQGDLSREAKIGDERLGRSKIDQIMQSEVATHRCFGCYNVNMVLKPGSVKDYVLNILIGLVIGAAFAYYYLRFGIFDMSINSNSLRHHSGDEHSDFLSCLDENGSQQGLETRIHARLVRFVNEWIKSLACTCASATQHTSLIAV